MDEQTKIENIKNLYIEMKLPEIYSNYEKETYDALKDKIETISFIAAEHKNIFIEILRTTYKRKA